MQDETDPDTDDKMNGNGKSFLKGTLPGWFTAILLAVIAFMGKGTMEEFREAKQLGVQTDKRVTVLELQNKSVQDAITDLRFSNKDILNEIRALGAQMNQNSKRP